MVYTSSLYLNSKNKTNILSGSSSFTASSSGNSMNDSIINAINNISDVDINIPLNELFITIITTQQPEFKKIIDNINLPPCMIFDNNSNLYITSDGEPNKLLKYNSNYELQDFVSDSAWVYGPNDNLPKTPVAMGFNKDFTYMYVTNFTHNSITVIDMINYSYKTLILIPENADNIGQIGYKLNGPNGLTFDTTYSYMIVTNVADSNLVKIDLSTPFTAKISPFNASVPFTQPILVTNDDTDNFYVSDLSQSIVYKVTDISYSIVAQIPNVFKPRGVSFNINNYNKLWVTNSTNSLNSTTDYPIVSIDLNTSLVVNSLNSQLFNNPRAILFDSENYMYIGNFGTPTNKGSILKSETPITYLT